MLNSFFKNPLLEKLFNFVSTIFVNEKHQVALTFIMFIMGIFTLNKCGSIRFTYKFFMAFLGFKLSNIYYYFRGEQLDLDACQLALIHACVQLVPTDCRLPIVLVIDDTLIEKFGDHFEACSTLHDHAYHNGTCYLHGHCFVCLTMQLPINNNGSYQYIKVPVAYKLWTPKEDESRAYKTKYQIAANMLENAYKAIGTQFKICVTCDAWYPKKEIIKFINKYDNVEAIVNARIDTALFDLPPEKTGKPGRPQVRGKKLSIDNFEFQSVPGTDYKVAYRHVITNLFGNKQVLAIVTERKSAKSRRLFICTDADACAIDPNIISDKNAKAIANVSKELHCYAVYSLRWGVETVFQEQKTYWGIADYMVRFVTNIERLMNIQSMAYAVLCILPWVDADFNFLKEFSIQDRRFQLGCRINRYLILSRCAAAMEKAGNLSAANACKQYANSSFDFDDVGS